MVERDVVVSKEAACAIADYLERERPADADAWNGSRALFLSVHSRVREGDTLKGRLRTETIRRVVAKIADRAGVAGIHPHLFRHQVGYLMNERGGITAVQKQLGHKNLTYSATYCQRTDEELSDALNSKHSSRS